VLYNDTVHLFSASVLARNRGFQLKKYDGAIADDLPFDLDLGITKRLVHAPLGFSITAHHVHQFDIGIMTRCLTMIIISIKAIMRKICVR